MKCVYCGRKIAAGLETDFPLDEYCSCCSRRCKEKAEKNLGKPVAFRLPTAFGIYFAAIIIAALADSLTPKLHYFGASVMIGWGLFWLLLPLVSKPVFSLPIRSSVWLTRICGLISILFGTSFIIPHS